MNDKIIKKIDSILDNVDEYVDSTYELYAQNKMPPGRNIWSEVEEVKSVYDLLCYLNGCISNNSYAYVVSLDKLNIILKGIFKKLYDDWYVIYDTRRDYDNGILYRNIKHPDCIQKHIGCGYHSEVNTYKKSNHIDSSRERISDIGKGILIYDLVVWVKYNKSIFRTIMTSDASEGFDSNYSKEKVKQEIRNIMNEYEKE